MAKEDMLEGTVKKKKQNKFQFLKIGN